MRRAAFVLCIACTACGGAPTNGPATQDVAIDRAPPAASSDAGDACPEGAHRESGICVTAATVTCPVGSKLVSGRCVVMRARTPGKWQAPAPLDPPDVSLARQRFSQGISLYQAGHYAEALAALEGAYAASPAPPVLYNIGVCLEQLGRLEEAVDAFDRFLDATPQSARTDETRTRIDRIRKMLGS